MRGASDSTDNVDADNSTIGKSRVVRGYTRHVAFLMVVQNNKKAGGMMPFDWFLEKDFGCLYLFLVFMSLTKNL